jgi:FixJ family two-component response regulator
LHTEPQLPGPLWPCYGAVGGEMSELSSIVFVVDDDPSIRAAIASLLRSAGLNVQCFDSARAFLTRVTANTDVPACLVLDVKLPGTSGLELQRELAETDRRMPIVFITGQGDIPTTVRAMKAGAVEFLAKPFRDQDLLDAIQSALARAMAVRREWTQGAALRARVEQLTKRERQVFELVVAGRLNKQIAGELGITEVTVKIHRARVMQKMQASSLADLVRMAARLEPPVSLQSNHTH